MGCFDGDRDKAREAWKDIVFWINFPETIFWSREAATRDYTPELLRSAAPGDRVVIGFTEMGVWGATDDETESRRADAQVQSIAGL